MTGQRTRYLRSIERAAARIREHEHAAGADMGPIVSADEALWRIVSDLDDLKQDGGTTRREEPSVPALRVIDVHTMRVNTLPSVPIPLIIKVKGQWREVFDMWETEEDIRAQFGDNDYTRLILERMKLAEHSYLAVRVLDEDRSTPSEVEDSWEFLRLCDLVEVQVPSLIPIPNTEQEK